MRASLRLSLVLVLLLGCAATARAATTIEQLVGLHRAGLDDDILIALIETDGSRFVLKAEDILALYKQGLSNRVIRAMQATARKPQTPPAPRDNSAAPPQLPVADAPLNDAAVPTQAAPPAAAPPQIVYVQAPPAPPVNVRQDVRQQVEVKEPEHHYVETIPVPVYVTAPVVVEKKPEPPVYWGWGGQRRPDSWDDNATQQKKP